ncbi:MAG: GNAT family N-acetyltransferase [Paracoccaceae bacterium]
MIPVLETDRLILRAPKAEDFDRFAAFFGSDRARYVGGPITREQAWRALAAELGHWHLRGYGRWALEEKETGAFCGIIGLWYPEGWPEPEIGWELMDGFEGRGFATEAAIAARTYAYDVVKLPTLISLILHENIGSARLAERLGATLEGEFTHQRLGLMQVWRHLGPEAVQ